MQVFHGAVAFDGVAVVAEELEVVGVVGAACRSGDFVVYGQVLLLEVRAAAVAMTRLLAVETCRFGSLVLAGEGLESDDVGTQRDVF